MFFSSCVIIFNLIYIFLFYILKAKQMPVTTGKLRQLVRSKHPYIEQNLGSVVSIIRHSMQNAAAFEAAAEHLKVGSMGMVRLMHTDQLITKLR